MMPLRCLVRQTSSDLTRFGVAVGLILVSIYLGLALFRGRSPGLPQIMEILLDGVLISSGGRLLIEGMRSERREMGVFSELRMAIVLGAVAMLYVAIGSLLRLILV